MSLSCGRKNITKFECQVTNCCWDMLSNSCFHNYNLTNTDSELKTLVSKALKVMQIDKINAWPTVTDTSKSVCTIGDRSKSCLSFSGNKIRDKWLCEAKNCCFDENAWDEASNKSDLGLCEWKAFEPPIWMQPEHDNTDKCCEKPVCFQKYSDHQTPKHASWTDWSSWSECSASCNSGLKMRSRECKIDQKFTVALDFCNGDALERLPCQSKSCFPASDVPIFETWSSWSVCSKTCGQGSQKRIKSCKNIVNEPVQCSGESMPMDARPCEIQSCERPWSTWSACSSETCEAGKRSRSRACGAYECQGLTDAEMIKLGYVQVESCFQSELCLSNWSSWSSCINSEIFRSRVCSNKEVCGNFPLRETQQCQSPLSNWSPWSACASQRYCGQGNQRRQRQCMT